MKEITGSQMIIEALHLEDVKVVFGYPGGAALNIYDEIYKQNYFKHILVRHEQAAVVAADGYARATGKVGVAVVTSGPGITNALTGIATAYMDSIPIIIISGQVSSNLIGTDAFQEIDAIGMSRPCVKHNFLVKNIQDLPRILKEAFYIAKSGRPGPVHIDIAKDVTATKAVFKYPSSINMLTYKPTYKGHLGQIKKAVELILDAKKPLFYIGGGVVSSNASEVVRELVEFTNIPAVETIMALGVLSCEDKNFIKMAGMHGSYAANMALSECDLLICLGARFDDRITGNTKEFAKYATIIHIDIDPSSISKIIHAHYPIVGDINIIVAQLLEELKKEKIKSFKDWHGTIKTYDKLHPLTYKDSKESIKPQWVIEESAKILGDNVIVSTDVGQHQMWVAQFYPFKEPRKLLTSGGLGTMGYGFPAAIGAKVAFKDATVVNFSGDGSILMNIQELATANEYGIPVINIILNNGFLGMVRQWQSMFYEERFSSTNLQNLAPDFVKLAQAFGGKGYKCESKDEFREALKDAVKSNKVCIIDVSVDRFEDVLPMVPAGGAIYNMILE